MTRVLCDCTVDDECPQGRVGLTPRCLIIRKEKSPYQSRVHDWIKACFPPDVVDSKTERNHRFLEEALELVQATGCTRIEAHQLVDYVFSREVGEASQEVGGVMTTLAALCATFGYDMDACAEIELGRCWRNIEKIRAKQAAKPKHSPLPRAWVDPRDEALRGAVTMMRLNSEIMGVISDALADGKLSYDQSNDAIANAMKAACVNSEAAIAAIVNHSGIDIPERP